MRRHLIAATTLAIAATALLAGCSGDNLEGTYLDARDDSNVLVIGPDGTCGSTESYDPEYDGPTPTTEIDDDCTWTRNGDELTFLGLMSYNIYGTVNDDGSITVPHQNHYSSALFIKQD